ncbi:hypothetical protein IQ254_23885 [Nodosilinea sp. LEGE 07088]|uniref:hypothetical protein n=1 Tax=Nodosilinea sp. LEGE 07088 TaxID=2777968 RepID=UPI001880CEDD|nr:hypothetical protein [Nodosilinea sp. LEGE 07088]MBE9140202.1 hypothetical protein [Nodosilinea sp. LEGE 07088]
MDNVFRYWQLVRLTSSGQCQLQVLPQVRAWLQSTFSRLIAGPDDLEGELQRSLLTHWRSPGPQADLAQLSLRCFITHQIRSVCLRLTTLFGETYGFTANELFFLVLDDDGQPEPTHRPFTLEVLETYDPAKAALSTWSSRLTNHHPALNRALLERGLYRVSDWAILNDTTPEQVQRILHQYHLCSEYEVAQAATLLERYHQVYRRDRIAQRQAGQTGRCQKPTPEQLHAINADVVAADLLLQLRILAGQLRQYRIHVRGGNPLVYQREEPNWDQIASDAAPLEGDNDQDEFVQGYRQALADCLGDAIAQVIQANLTRLQSRQPPRDRAYVQGLHLFHCQGLSMGKLADEIGLSSQVQVSRLLDLKRLKADVRHELVPRLCETVRHQALNYISADRLRAIDHTLENLLNEEVNQMIAAAEAEAKIPQGRTAKSLFARQLCTTIHQFMPGTE